MIGFANTKFSILRGSLVNDLGDEIDNNLVAASGIQGSRKELFARTGREVNPDTRIIRRERVRLPRMTDIGEGDRLGDELTGDILLVDDIETPKSFGLALDLVLTATLVESVDVPALPSGISFNPFRGYHVQHFDGPVTSVLVEHSLGYPHHTSVFVGGELVLATVTPSLDFESTVVEFEDPESDILVVCSL